MSYDSKLYEKIIDFEKEMDFFKDDISRNYSDRITKLESAVSCLNDKMNIFVPHGNKCEDTGVKAFFGKVNYRLMKHNKEINQLKATVERVTKA